MAEKLIREARPFFPKQDIDMLLRDIAKALEDGRLRNGENLRTFETMFAKYIGPDNAAAFDADGSALEAALQYYEIRGCEVVVCTNSFVSIPNSIVYAGGKPVFTDIRGETLSMDPNSLQENLSKKTVGVVVTHISGFPNPDLKEIAKICKEHDLFLIEDATHAVGATVDGRKVGSFGDAGIFAFTPTKVMTTGEGGMLVTNNAELDEKARRLRFYGSGPGKTNFVDLGRHMVLPEVSAILGIYQLRRLEEFISQRNLIAKIYAEGLSRLDVLRIVECPRGCRSSYYKYPLILGEKLDRIKFAERLEKECKVETGTVFYPPCHMQPVYQKACARIDRDKLSVSEKVLARTITLPIHAAMTEEDAKYVVASVLSLVSRFS